MSVSSFLKLPRGNSSEVLLLVQIGQTYAHASVREDPNKKSGHVRSSPVLIQCVGFSLEDVISEVQLQNERNS